MHSGLLIIFSEIKHLSAMNKVERFFAADNVMKMCAVCMFVDIF